jgi:uncharacterized membrane protein HdeD (DUF308 family)
MESATELGSPASGRRRAGHGLATYATVSGVLAAFVGIWLLVSPFLLGYGETGRWNHLFTGVLVVLFGALLALLGQRDAVLSGLLAMLGGWLVLASFVLNISAAARWNDLASGALLAALALASTVRSPKEGR